MADARLAAALPALLATAALAQPPANPPAQANAIPNVAEDADGGPPPGFVRLTFPGPVELPVLVDYVSERLGIRVLHDAAVTGQSITLRANGDIPVASLEELLRGALRIKGFVLADAPLAGWKTIEPAAELPRVAGAGGDAVTRVFELDHADPSGLTTLLEPFLSDAGASAVAVEGTRLLIVTEFGDALPRVEGLIRAVDRPRVQTETRFVDVTNTAAEDLAARLTELLAAAAPAPGGGAAAAGDDAGGGVGGGRSAVTVVADARTNRAILVGPPAAVDRAAALAEALDAPLGLETEVFELTAVPAERLDRLARGVLGERDAGRLYRSVVDADANVLIVTAPPAALRRVAELVERLDAPGAAPAGGRVRFYKLKYATAEEVLETVLAVAGGGGLPAAPPGGLPRTDGRFRLLGRPAAAGGQPGRPAAPAEPRRTPRPAGPAEPPGSRRRAGRRRPRRGRPGPRRPARDRRPPRRGRPGGTARGGGLRGVRRGGGAGRGDRGHRRIRVRRTGGDRGPGRGAGPSDGGPPARTR